MTLRLDPSGQVEGETDALLGLQVYGGFVIKKKLGEGGMGAVYLAEDEDIGKRVAIKVLHPAFSSHGEALARFLGEARAASQIQHANIVEFEAKGVLSDGRAFLAMEFLDGSPLDQHLASWKVLAPAHALAILLQAGWALGAAHLKGIVHRDVKPENIFLTDRPGIKMFVKVLDFGIAKFADPSIVGGFKTKVGMLIGTPAYMSPEQARGSLEVDHRTDIYALSVVAYQMVTGVMPEADPATNQWRDPRAHRPELPEGLARAILWALSLHPDARPRTMREWLLALVAATEDGAEVVNEYARGFLDEAAPDEATRKNTDGDRSAVPTPWTPAPSTTTFGHARGEATGMPRMILARGTRLALAALVLVGVAITIVVVAASQNAPSDKPTTNASTSAHVTAVDAMIPIPSTADQAIAVDASTMPVSTPPSPDAAPPPDAPSSHDAAPPTEKKAKPGTRPRPPSHGDEHALPQGNDIVE